MHNKQIPPGAKMPGTAPDTNAIIDSMRHLATQAVYDNIPRLLEDLKKADTNTRIEIMKILVSLLLHTTDELADDFEFYVS